MEVSEPQTATASPPSPAQSRFLAAITRGEAAVALSEPIEHPGTSSELIAEAAGTVSHALNDGVHVLALGHFQFPDPEYAALSQREGKAAAIQAIYRQHGIAVTDHLRGQYGLLLLDAPRNRLVAATDRFGTVPIHYSLSARHVVAGSHIDEVLNARDNEGVRSDQAVLDYCYFHMIPAPASILAGIAKLPAAHRLVWEDGDYDVSPYWVPDFSRKSAQPSAAALDAELRDLLKAAVQRACNGSDSPAAFLSGGLDSSTVAGLLAGENPGARAYCIGFEAEGYDEVPYARITARHFELSLEEYYLSPDDIVDSLPILARSTQEPFGNSSLLPAYYCARIAAADGVDRMLAGDGGDELFAGNERYLKQRVFSHYARVPKLLREGLIEPLASIAPPGFTLARKFSSYVKQARTPLPDRLQTYNFLHQFSVEQMFQPDFLRAVDLEEPLQLVRAQYQRPESGSELDRMLYHDWQITLADNDLRKVGHACQMAGVDVVYPLLDDDLTDFSIGIPDHIRLENGNLRGFYKRALKGWLPEATLKKSKHGFGLPFGVWMRDHKPLQELVYDSIEALKRRSIFLDDFLDRSVELHRDGHASYYGELLWVLTCLEFWLEPRMRGDRIYPLGG